MGSLWWYLARSTGFVAWLTASASILFGLALASRYRGRVTPAWVLAMHRWCSTLTVALVAGHLLALFADGYVEFTVTDLLIPGASGYRTTAVAFGVVSLWVLALVEVTSLLRRQFSRRVWHTIHLASYLAWAMATWHGLSAGTDGGRGWYLTVTGMVAGAVTGLTAYRIGEGLVGGRRQPNPRQPNPRPLAAR